MKNPSSASHATSLQSPKPMTHANYTNIGKIFSLFLIIIMVFLLLTPVLTIFTYLIFPDNNTAEVWQHLLDTVLFEYISNSVIMAVGVSLIASILGISTAWFTSVYRFPAHRLFPLLLMLPMAVPSYIIAFTYAGLLDTGGVVQDYYRQWSGLEFGDYWFPEVHNIYGATAMLGLVLYPYVFLLVRASFLSQSAHALQVGQTLGLTTRQRFFRIALPLSRPAIIAGIALVTMETLANYGTVQYYGVATFTTGIYRTWVGLDELGAAINLSAMLLCFVMVCLGVEYFSRRKIRYTDMSKSSAQMEKQTPSKTKQAVLFTWCLLPVLLGFIIPSIQLVIWAWSQLDSIDQQFWLMCWNSFYLAFMTAFLAVTLTFLIYAFQRFYQNSSHINRLIQYCFRAVGLGYAIPGIVVAIAIIIPSGLLSNHLNNFSEQLTGESLGWILNGTLTLLIFAYLVRFIAVAMGSVESGYNKINPHIDDAARSMQVGFFGMMQRIHLPMMYKVLLTATLIIFVDVLKELPTTLILRPFNFNTLAVNAFELASDEFLAEASLPALFIVITGLIPVYILNRSIGKDANHQQSSS